MQAFLWHLIAAPWTLVGLVWLAVWRPGAPWLASQDLERVEVKSVKGSVRKGCALTCVRVALAWACVLCVVLVAGHQDVHRGALPTESVAETRETAAASAGTVRDATARTGKEAGRLTALRLGHAHAAAAGHDEGVEAGRVRDSNVLYEVDFFLAVLLALPMPDCVMCFQCR